MARRVASPVVDDAEDPPRVGGGLDDEDPLKNGRRVLRSRTSARAPRARAVRSDSSTSVPPFGVRPRIREEVHSSAYLRGRQVRNYGEGYNQLVSLGALAWNACRFPDGNTVVADGLAALGLGEEDLEIARDVVASLCTRCRSLFPDDRRLIISTVATLTPSGDLMVSAAHAPIKDAAPLGE
jgi:hypothetical protein